MSFILVIDAHSDLRAFIADVLTRAGHAVAEAPDARAGAALLRRQSVRMVVSDLLPTSRDPGIAQLRRAFPEIEFIALADTAPAASCLRLAASLDERRTRAKPFACRFRIALFNELVAGVAAHRAHEEYLSGRLALAS